MPDLERIVEQLEPLAAQIAVATLIVIFLGLVYLLVIRALKTLQYRRKLPAPLAGVLRRIARWVALIVTALLVLQSFGLLENAWTAFTTVAAMIAIGFVAVWSVMSNGLCSMIILIMRPFRVGDQIELAPEEIGGKVVNFNMIYTTLRTEDETLIQVPNNLFLQRIVRRRPGDSTISLDEQFVQKENAEV